MKDRWGLSVLGTAVLQRPGRPTETLERKAAALLAYVAIAGSTPRATVAGLLWPNVVDARARNNLRQLLHRLRTFEDLLEPGGDLRLGAVAADVTELQELHAAGRADAVAERWGMHAPMLLEGHSYDDCPDLAEWVIAERERLLDIVRRSLEVQADRLEAAGDVRRALQLAQRLSALDPLSEAGYRRVMRLHYLSGDRGQAMAAFRRCRQVLRETFGLEPLPDTVELARAIDSGSSAAPRPRPTVALPITLLRPPRLLGREAAWRALEDAWRRVHTIVVLGEPGIGKSHLMHDFAATRGGVLVTRGMPGDRNVAYASKARSLAAILREHPDYADEPWIRDELARILPELFPRPAGQTPITDEPQKLRLFEAAARVLARALEGKAVLVNEDAHLWDDASFEMGAYFVTRFADAPVRALVSYRPDEMGLARVRAMRAAAESGLAEIVTLEPLGLDAIEGLIAETGMADAASPASLVLQVSSGNPFYALEFLRNAWQKASGATPDGGDALPSSAAGVLSGRIERLSRAAADVLRMRAMAGTAFSMEIAAAVLEVPSGSVRAGVDELERHRLLHEGELAHELVADAIEGRTPPEAARLWHRRLAVQLEVFDEAPAPIATHYLAAWEPTPAFPHLLRAGDGARAVFALEEAERWYLRALWAAPDEAGRGDALLRLDDVAAQRGRNEDAEALLEELERVASILQDPVLLIESALRRARWATVRGEHSLAARKARQALDDALHLGDADRIDQARLVLGDIAYFSGAYPEAHDHFLEVTRTGHEARRLRAFQRLGALEAMRGDVDAAFEHHRQALTLARHLHDVPLIATLLNSLGADRERRGRYEQAIGHFTEAAEVALRAADRRTGAIALSNASLTEVSRGALAAALGHAERALEVSASLGADRSAAMANFAHGYALRRLGRFAPARAALREAARLREAASDVRGALVARFNLAAIDLETATGGERDAATVRVEAVLEELAQLNIPQFYAWCLLEQALLTGDPALVRERVAQATALDDGAHLRLAAAIAALRGGVLAGANGAATAMRRSLQERLEAGPVLETSLAYLLLAHTAPSAEERHVLLERADARLDQEVGVLGRAATRSRRDYLARRLPRAD